MLKFFPDQLWEVCPYVPPEEPLQGTATSILGLVLIDPEDCCPQVPLSEVLDLQQNIFDLSDCPLCGRIAHWPVIRRVMMFNMM